MCGGAGGGETDQRLKACGILVEFNSLQPCQMAPNPPIITPTAEDLIPLTPLWAPSSKGIHLHTDIDMILKLTLKN